MLPLFTGELLHRFATRFKMIHIRISPGNYLIELGVPGFDDHVFSQYRVGGWVVIYIDPVVSRKEALLTALRRRSGEIMFPKKI